MKLLLSKRAKDFLDTLPPKPFRQVVLTVFQLLAEPYPQDAKQSKAYSYHRVDVGEYRVVYAVNGEELHVLVVGKRNDDDVYKRLKRLKG